MVKVSPGYLWQRGDATFIGEFYFSRGWEAFEFYKEFHQTSSHQKRDIILTRMLEW